MDYSEVFAQLPPDLAELSCHRVGKPDGASLLMRWF